MHARTRGRAVTARKGEARPQGRQMGRRVGSGENVGGYDVPAVRHDPVGGGQTGPGSGADTVGGKLRGLSPSLGWHRQMPGPSRENKGTEFMRHTEAKMDISQNTTPSELNHRGRPFVILSSRG